MIELSISGAKVQINIDWDKIYQYFTNHLLLSANQTLPFFVMTCGALIIV